jgi:hypothetical protein
MAYAWHAFIETPAVGKADFMTRFGNGVFAGLAALLVATMMKRMRVPQSEGREATRLPEPDSSKGLGRRRCSAS